MLFVERGGKTLVPLRDPDPEWLRPALAALVEHVKSRRGTKRLAVERFDGEPVGRRTRCRSSSRPASSPARAAPFCGRDPALLIYRTDRLLSYRARLRRQGARQRRDEVERRAALAERAAPLEVARAARRGLRLPRRRGHPGLSPVEQHGSVRHASGSAAAGLPAADRRVREAAGAARREGEASRAPGSRRIPASTQCSVRRIRRSRARGGSTSSRMRCCSMRSGRGPKPSS